MLDTRSRLVLKYIGKECEGGSYKIIDACDIISSLPNRFKLDSDELEKVMEHLDRQDYISVKYNDDVVYCVCILPSGREVLETSFKDNKKVEVNIKPLSWWVYALLFAISLLGAFLGGIISRFIV